MATPNDRNDKITYFAETDYRSRRIKFGIKDSDRAKHMYVIGKTGMGKSTLLENLAAQDIQNGEGLCFIDPHGGTAETLLTYVPEHRIKDVVYFAPFDIEYPVALNVLEDIGRDKRQLVASGLMGAFKKVWVDAWSARMEYLLNNALLALLEYPGSTLLGVNRIFSDKNFRAQIVNNVEDPSVKLFWTDEFAKYTDKFATEAAAAIQNKVGQFSANPLIRNMIGQPKSTFDIRKVMDEKKILIVNLSKGRMGEGNANLIGSMLITKIYLAAMSRADVGAEHVQQLPSFHLYVDEFQSFANESFADILSEARKYKLSLTIAHQYIEQMSDEVRAAVFGNVGTMIAFRVGSYDAEVLEKEFAPEFTAEDLVNLGFAQIYLKLMINGIGSHPFSATTLPPVKRPPMTYVDQVVAKSREQFARPRALVEEEIKKWHDPVPEPPRDPNAPQVPETRKYAPGMRPMRPPTGGGMGGQYQGDGMRRPAPRPPMNGYPPQYPNQYPPQQQYYEYPPQYPDQRMQYTQYPPQQGGVVMQPPQVASAPYAPVQQTPVVQSRPSAPIAQMPPIDTVRAPQAHVPTAEVHQPFKDELARLVNAAPPTPVPQVVSMRPTNLDQEKKLIHPEHIQQAPREPYRGPERRQSTRQAGERPSPGEGAPAAPAGGSRSVEDRRASNMPSTSLSSLKTQPKRDKGPSEENLSGLRAALLGVQRNAVPEKIDDRSTAGTAVASSGAQGGGGRAVASSGAKTTELLGTPNAPENKNNKEVPEEVLRKMLEL